MNHRLLLAAVAAVGSLCAVHADAQTVHHHHRAHATAARTDAVAPAAGAAEDYRAVVSDEAATPRTRLERRTPQTSAWPAPLGPDGYLPVEKQGSSSYHALGTMSVP